ncbi:MAG: phenylalanine--tRNA ligase subunit alpha [Myxococcota bacterium]
MEVSELEERLDDLAAQAVEDLEGAERKEDAIQIKNRFLGRKGEVQELMSVIRDLPNEDKPRAGKASNQAKSRIEGAYEARLNAIEERELQRQLEAEAVDVTLPARDLPIRGANPLRNVERELLDIFSEMGFEVARGPEIEEDFYNFEALNFPPDHPARDMQDTFLLEDGRVLRTHTSPVQIRTMLSYEPPVRIVAPGRVYRCDSDVTHSPVFHQIEGLLVDENVTFANLKATLHTFVERYYGEGTPIRFRPSYFPFTEPSAEVDIGCIFCEGSGCRVCGHTGWLEILGAGMVDPNVFEASDVDPDKYTGFAFGLGVERIGMLKLGVDDIRLFFENDLRFLRQF